MLAKKYLIYVSNNRLAICSDIFGRPTSLVPEVFYQSSQNSKAVKTHSNTIPESLTEKPHGPESLFQDLQHYRHNTAVTLLTSRSN